MEPGIGSDGTQHRQAETVSRCNRSTHLANLSRKPRKRQRHTTGLTLKKLLEFRSHQGKIASKYKIYLYITSNFIKPFISKLVDDADADYMHMPPRLADARICPQQYSATPLKLRGFRPLHALGSQGRLHVIWISHPRF